MTIRGVQFSLLQLLCLSLYYGFLQFLPSGKVGRWLRYHCCRHIFAYCGKNVNIEHRACFGSGHGIHIGDNSGIGVRCFVPSNTLIGKDVMMAPDCYIFPYNHRFDRTDIPMIEQGKTEKSQTVIEDDVWIGRQVLMTPGRTICKGSIIAAGCVLCKDFPAYSIVGGNPSRLIKKRTE